MINIEIGIMCSSAYASNEKYDWTLSISKKNDSAVGEIAKKHKEEVTSQYLREYLPGWEDVEWRKLKVDPFFPQELMGECGDYKLHIVISDKNKKNNEAIKQEFKEFMQL